jgi:hypothetical protein
MNSEATAGSGTAAANPATETRGFAPALARVQHELESMTEAELVPINIDIASAAATVLGALPEIEREFDQIAGLPRVDQALIRKLGDYAGALMYTHGVFRAAAGPADNVGEIAEKAIEDARSALCRFRFAIASLERGRRLVAEERVGAAAVVEDLDVFEDVSACGVAGREDGAWETRLLISRGDANHLAGVVKTRRNRAVPIDTLDALCGRRTIGRHLAALA